MTKTKGPISADRLKSFIERIEKLEEERHAIGGDIRNVYSEAKGVGYDVKTMRKVVSLRKMDMADRAEQETLLDTYMHALGMVDRIEARAAAGETSRQIAAAEGVSKSTAHRVSQKAQGKIDSAETGHDPETGEINGHGQGGRADEGARGQDASHDRHADGLLASNGGQAERGDGEGEHQDRNCAASGDETGQSVEVGAAASEPTPQDDIDLSIPKFLDRRVSA